MTLLTKTPVTPDQARAIAETHFGRSLAAFEALSDGFYNAAYRLDLAGGDAVVLKVAPRDEVAVLSYERNILAAEVGALRLVRARTDIPVPRVHVHDTSRALLPADFFIMDFVSGRSYFKLHRDLPPEAIQAVDTQMGRCQRQMNAIRGESFGYFASGPRFARWADCFDHMLRGVLADGRAAGVHLPMADAALLALARGHYPALDAVTEPRLVHWDLWDGNVFIDPETFRITGILDFERALWGDPLMEVGFGGLIDKPDFLAGYGEDLLAAPGAAARKTLYNLYLYLIMVIEPTYRQYDNDQQENWARERLAETLGALGA
jgi:aminoglycoside phosphotransferase (APT) family kinase protein